MLGVASTRWGGATVSHNSVSWLLALVAAGRSTMLLQARLCLPTAADCCSANRALLLARLLAMLRLKLHLMLHLCSPSCLAVCAYNAAERSPP